jgi:uncharacterized RDD family membrane protein YckC
LLIATPEGCTFGLLLAGPLTRFLAWFIDLCCCAAAFIVLAIVIAFSPLMFAPGLAAAIIMLAIFALWFGYGVIMEWFWRGRTIGKMCLGLRVMDEHGLPLSFSQVLVRNLLRFVDALPGLYMVAGITCVLTRRLQRLGDLAAGTVVVKTRQAPRPDVGKILGDKYNSFRAYPTLEARLRQQVLPQAARVALTSLMRREQLDPAARLDVYRQVADYFRQIVQFPDAATEGLSDEQYVRNVVDSLFRSQMKR